MTQVRIEEICPETLKESLVPLAKIQTNISAATREVEKVEREVSEQHKVVEETVKQSFKQLHEILHNREKQLLDKASELKQQKLDNPFCLLFQHSFLMLLNTYYSQII